MNNDSKNNQSFKNLIKQIEEIPLPNIRGQRENAKRNYPKIYHNIMETRNYNELGELLHRMLLHGSFEEKVALKKILDGLSIKDKIAHGLVEIVKLNLIRQTKGYTNNTRRSKSRKSRKTRKNRKNQT
jgi:hypothetical protein